VGRQRYRQAQRLLITADAGASNGLRLRLWKTEIQGAGQPDADPDFDLSLPSRNQQVEQDLTSALFLHQSELVREAADQPRRDREAVHGDPNKDWSESPLKLFQSEPYCWTTE
jgi:hypothetical protein